MLVTSGPSGKAPLSVCVGFLVVRVYWFAVRPFERRWWSSLSEVIRLPGRFDPAGGVGFPARFAGHHREEVKGHLRPVGRVAKERLGVVGLEVDNRPPALHIEIALHVGERGRIAIKPASRRDFGKA